VRDRAAAQILYERLAPSAGQIVYSGPNAWMGVDHHLGTLAIALGRPFLAKRHLVEAAALHERMGAPLWHERTQEALARLQDDLAAGRLRPDAEHEQDPVDRFKERT
jgi:hypothetical protein